MIDPRDWDRLARFAAGECSSDEANTIAGWADETAERRDALAFIREIVVAVEAGRPQWDTAASWERLAARGRARERTRAPLQLTPAKAGLAGRPRWWIAAAAGIAIVVGASVGVWQPWRSVVGYRASVPLASDMREHVTARGERSAFQLPDGTPVVLAAASRLRYAPSFNIPSGRRDVYLEGRALFQVKHDSGRPFVVHTAHGVTEDLGTRFVVQEYAGDPVVEVVVAEGRVELRAPAQARGGTLLRPGQVGRLTPGGNAAIQTGVDLDRYLSWTQGRLVFEDTPLRDALPELGRWYDLDFVLADSALGSRHLTAALAGEAIAETLTLLGSTLDLSYERHGRTVTFSPRRRR